MANSIEIYVDFIENQLPGLKSGNYTLHVEQTLHATGVDTDNVFAADLKFSVAGERFSLLPSDIASVFPPPNSLGEHSSVLPQVVFTRNTLPWERRIAEPKDKTDDELKTIEKMPWLALLVFNEDEAAPSIQKLADLLPKIGVALETGEHSDQKVSVIQAKKSLLKNLLPPALGLQYLCHARESSLRLNLDTAASGNVYYEIWDSKQQLTHAAHLPDSQTRGKKQITIDPGPLEAGQYSVRVWINGNEISLASSDIAVSPNDEFGHKVAVVVANRLPKPGARSVVHLVSVEGRYHWDGSAYTFNFGTATDDESVSLVSLKTWSFSCVADKHNFDKILKNLITAGKGDSNNTLRLPLRADPHGLANRFLQNGYVPMPHFFRRGGKNVSWYRGPLAPGTAEHAKMETLLPAPCSDALLVYNEQFGMFNVSYAAAWELGRLMALRNKKFSTGLYHWKRLHQRQILLAEQQELHPHLPFHKDASRPVDMPDDIENWLSSLSLLRDVPFNYLVPDEQMLPAESIRFFQLDQDWISCLIDGAFSIGRVTSGNADTDKSLYVANLTDGNAKTISGFLLRSYAVAGWPDLQVNGYGQMPEPGKESQEMTATPLKLLHKDTLSANVLLCFFEGDLHVADLYQKTEMLHLGFDLPDNPLLASDYNKNLRNPEGIERAGQNISLGSNWNPATRVINIGNLCQMIIGKKLGYGNTFTSAQFALSMMEGMQKVRLIRKSKSQE